MKIPFKYSVRGFLQRKFSTIMTCLAFALVIFTLLITLAMVEGIEQTLISSGSENRFFAISSKTTSESQSKMEDNDPFAIDGYDEIKIDTDGMSLTSHEIVTTTSISGQTNNLFRQIIRGVDLDQAVKIHDNMSIVKGRYFSTNRTNEIIVGKGAANSMELNIGHQVFFQKRAWYVVGIFEDNNSPMESEIWTSRENVELAFKKKYVSSVWGILKDKYQTTDFVKRLNNETLLTVYALTEKEYYSRGSSTAKLYKYLGWFVAILLSIGAIFSAMNTMYASIAARIREIGTLRAIGFKKLSIFIALLGESMTMAISGSLIAIILALFLDGYTLSMNIAGIGKVLYQLQITGKIIITGFLFAGILGLVSGSIPSQNALRVDVVTSLKS